MTIDPLAPDFTRADLAAVVNALVFTGYMGLALIVFALAILVFRGK